MKNVYEEREGFFIYNGYFNLEQETLPVKRVLYNRGKLFYVEILQKKVMEDTSKYFQLEEGMRVSLFPTNCIELEYKILKEIPNTREFRRLCDSIEAEEPEVQERDRENKIRKQKEEYESRAFQTIKKN